MNITVLNTLIDANNDEVEARIKFGKALEEFAWTLVEDHAGMPGVRPIAAAELYRPDLVAEAEAYEAAQVQAEPATSPEPVAAPETTADVTLVQLRTLLAQLSQSGLTEKVRALLGEFGYDKLSAVPEEQFAALFARAKELK